MCLSIRQALSQDIDTVSDILTEAARWLEDSGIALWRATDMPEAVAVVVVYYPSTSFVSEARDLARRFRIPVLMLAGEQDATTTVV